MCMCPYQFSFPFFGARVTLFAKLGNVKLQMEILRAAGSGDFGLVISFTSIAHGCWKRVVFTISQYDT